MIVLIDCFNLIYKFSELEGLMYENRLNEAKSGLLKILHSYKNKRKNVVIHAFFDGKKNIGSEVRQEDSDGIKIFFSHDLTADHLLKQFIRSNPNPSDLTVVSSDNDIIFYSKRFKCKIQKSEEFAKLVNDFLSVEPEKPEKESEVNLTGREIEYWKDLFQKKRK